MSSLPLFDDAPVPDDVDPLRRLQVVPQAGAPLSAAARAYNLQLARVDKLKSQLAEMEALSLAHRHALTQRVFPLTTRHQALKKQMALWLDGQLTQPPPQLKLSPTQRLAAVQMVCNLAAQLVSDGLADMAAVHDRHSPTSLAELARAHARTMKAELEAMMGEAFMPDHPDATLEDVMQAAKARMQQAVAEEQATREAAAAKRKAKKAARADAKGDGKAPNAAQALQAALQGDADTSLRTLYRQLAGALHPDRETDPHERVRKTALMSEANAAYARKDIVTLMDIQQRVALADPHAVASLPDDKLKSLTLLVKAQVAELERERARAQQALCQEFDVISVTARSLEHALMENEDELTDAVHAMQEDLALVQQPAGFKRWLTLQVKLSQQMERAHALRAHFRDRDGY
jgi:hypothetical protein